MQRKAWLGLLDFDGREVALPGYRRVEVHVDLREDAVALLAEADFPMIEGGRGDAAEAVVYDGPSDGEPIGPRASLRQPFMLQDGTMVAFKPGWLVR